MSLQKVGCIFDAISKPRLIAVKAPVLGMIFANQSIIKK